MKPSQCEACRAVGPTVMCNLCPTGPRRSVQPPATPQEPSGAQLALADIERAYSETEVALAQVVSRNDKELFFNGDKALRAHLQKNLDYYRIRRDGVRALLASAPPAVWQPIETAPKDRALLLLEANGSMTVGHFNPGYTEKWHALVHGAEAPWSEDDPAPIFNATHWMPLPSPPTPGENR